MKILSAKKQDFSFLIETEDGCAITVPDDMDNNDRVQLQAWLDEGNKLEEDLPAQNQPTYNWQGLAIAFKLSELNQILNQLKDEGKNPQVNAIWRISDELVQVITLPVFGESDRVNGLTQEIQSLFQKLEEGGVDVPRSAVKQIAQALKDNGFSSVADAIASRSSVA